MQQENPQQENLPLTQEHWDNLRSLLLSRVSDPEKFHKLRKCGTSSAPQSRLESTKEGEKLPPMMDLSEVQSFGQILKPLPPPAHEISERRQLQSDLNDPILHKETLAKLRKSDRFSVDYDGCGWIVYCQSERCRKQTLS